MMMSSGDPELVKFCVSFSILMVNRLLNESHLSARIFVLFFDSITFGYLESYEFKLLGG